MGTDSKKALFAIVAVAMMMCLPVLTFAEDNDAAFAYTGLPVGSDYGFVVDTAEITTSVVGNGIVGVTYYDANGDAHILYSDTNTQNLLYNSNGTEKTTDENPNYNDYLKFDEGTGLGPFNSFYVAVNIATKNNSDQYRTSNIAGQVAYILNPNNLKQAIIDNGSGPYRYDSANPTYYDIQNLSDYNIFLYIPTVYWYSNEDHLWLSNQKDFFTNVDPDHMEARAHTIEGQIRPFLGLGVYEASEYNGSLVSQSGNTPLSNKSVEQFRDMVDTLNTNEVTNGEYMLWNYYQWTLYKMMSYTVIGTKNSQSAIGEGDTRTQVCKTTGLGDEGGAYWGGGASSYKSGSAAVKLFLENTWGSYHDLLDDVWVGEGQLHAGQNSIKTIKSHILHPTATGTDGGLNDNQMIINNAVFPMSVDNKMYTILRTSTNPTIWDFPTEVADRNVKYYPNGDAVHYKVGYETVSVGGHYDSQDVGGLNRMNVRNGFGEGRNDVGTRIAYVTYGGTISYTEDAEKYTVTSTYGDLSNGTTVFSGVEVQVVPKDGTSITYVAVNGEIQNSNSFSMPKYDVNLTIVTGNTIPIPDMDASGCISRYSYDGESHIGIHSSLYYTITGTNSATVACQKDGGGDYIPYTVTVTLKDGFQWSDGTTGSKTFNWVIEKRTLLIEGSSSAEISKTYDGTRNLGTDAAEIITAEDLFIYGIADGEVPSVTYTAQYRDAKAGTNKVIDVSALTLNNNGSFDLANYEYTFKSFFIMGSKVVINRVNINNNLSVSAIDDQVYTGNAIAPEPVVKVGNKTLTKGTDYKLIYSNNINAGTASVKIEGQGNYNSSKTVTFTIVKKQISWPDVTIADYTGQTISDGLQDTDWYTVVTHGSGTAVGSYSAKLRISDPSNVKWTDTDDAEKTATSLTIRDVQFAVVFLPPDPQAVEGYAAPHFIDGYEKPTSFYSSTGLTLPTADKVVPYVKPGYTVTFVGWFETGDVNETIVTSIPANTFTAKSYTAKFSETPNNYTVTFSTAYGTVPSQVVQYNGLVSRPSDPTDTYHNFQGWYKTYNNGEYSDPWNFSTDKVKGNMMLYAKWTDKTYTVTWKNWDGTVLETDLNVSYNNAPVFNSSNPVRANTDQYSYSFTGWSPAITPVTADVVYTAMFSETLRSYPVTIPLGDIYIVENKSGTNPAPYGSTYSFYINPNPDYEDAARFSQLRGLTVLVGEQVITPAADGSYTTPAITGPTTVTIQGIMANMYTVTLMDEANPDHVYLQRGNVAHGSHVSDVAVPSNPHTVDVSKNYAFTYWTKGSNDGPIVYNLASEAITADTTYYAHFSSTTKTFRVNYTAGEQFSLNILNGTDKNAVPYGESFQFTITTNNPAYSKLPDNIVIMANGNNVPKDSNNIFTVSNITSDVNLVFNNVSVNDYSITWKNWDGSVLLNASHKHGTTVNANLNPTKEETESHTYRLAGWKINGEGAPVEFPYVVTNDVVFVAYFEELLKVYNVTLQQSSRYTIAGAPTVNHGSSYSFTFSGYGDKNNFVVHVNGVAETSAERSYDVSVSGGVYTYTVPNVTGSIEVTVTLSSGAHWTVTWNYNGTSSTTTVADGAAPIPPLTPTKGSTAQYHYTFKGWSEDGTNTVVIAEQRITAAVTYTALFDEFVNTYDVIIPAGPMLSITDVSSVLTDNICIVEYGNNLSFKVSYSGNPAYAQFSQLRGLTVSANGTTLQPVEGTYTITDIREDTVVNFSFVINLYTVSFKDEYGNNLYTDDAGTELIADQSRAHGTHIADPGTPKKPSDALVSNNYTFTHWTKNSFNGPTVDLSTEIATADTVYYAHFDVSEKTFKINYTDSALFRLNLIEEEGCSTDKDAVPYGKSFKFTVQFFPESYSQMPDRIVVRANGVLVPKDGQVFTISNVTEDKVLAFSGITVNDYTVTWKNGEDTVRVDTVKYDAVPNAPDMSFLDDAQYTYSVAWSRGGQTVDLSTEHMRSDITYTAVLTPTLNKYIVTWKNWDGTVLGTYTGQDYGSTPSYNGSTPARESDDLYRYNFAGWTPEITTVSGDVTYTAMFTPEQTKAYVTWMNPNGRILQNVLMDVGSTPSFEGTPTMMPTAQYTYTFKEWSPAITPVAGNVTYTAVYDSTVNNYMVTWINYDSTVLQIQESVPYGTVPSYTLDTPVRPADVQYTYTFKGWTPAVSAVTGNTVYTAEFDATVNKYTVTWKNWDGTVLKTESVDYGTVPSYSGITPTKTLPAEYKYSWSGWDKPVVAVGGNAEYTAAFTSKIFFVNVTVKASEEPLHKYGTVTNAGTYQVRSDAVISIEVLDEDGTNPEGFDNILRISGLDVEFGATPAPDEGYVGLLVGWYVTGDMKQVDDGYEINGEDLCVEPRFIEVLENYTVLVSTTYGSEGQFVFSLDGGDYEEFVTINDEPVGTLITVKDDHTLEIGTHLITFEPVVRPDMTSAFDHWEYIMTGRTVQTGDRTDELMSIGMCTTPTTHQSVVTWKDWDGTVLKTETLFNGMIPEYEPDPIRPADDTTVYVFSGWDPAITAVADDITYTAQYTAYTDSAIITVDLNGGTSTVVNEANGWNEDSNGYFYKVFDVGAALDFGTVSISDDQGTFPLGRWVDSGGYPIEVGTVSGFTFYKAEYRATVTYMDDSGSVIDTQLVASGSTPSHADPTKADEPGRYYTFNYWTKNGERVNLSEETVYEDTTYVAVFTTHYKSYTVTFNPNGGKSMSVTSKIVTYGSPYGDMPVPSRDDYMFGGWYTPEGAHVSSSTIYECTDDQTLYAYWIEIYIPPEPEPEPQPGPDDPGTETHEEIIVNPDGSITDKVTEKTTHEDGSTEEKVEETTTHTDGTVEEKKTETVINTDGSSQEKTEEKTTRTDGSTEEKKTETIVSTDGTVKERTEEKTVNSDGSSQEKKTETIINTDGSKRETVIERETDSHGSTTERTEEKETAKDGTHETTNTVVFPNGGWVTTESSGDTYSDEIADRIEIGIKDEMSKEQKDLVDEDLEKISKGGSPDVVIISDTPVAVPESIVESIVEGDGSLTFIEDGNELFFKAKTLKDMSLTVIESLSIAKTEDIPEKYKQEMGVSYGYDIKIVINGAEYHSQFSEPVRVTIPFELGPGGDLSLISVYYLGDPVEELDFTYEDGCVVFYLPHMSLYTITYDYTPAEPDQGGIPWMYIAIAAIIIIAILVILVWRITR